MASKDALILWEAQRQQQMSARITPHSFKRLPSIQAFADINRGAIEASDGSASAAYQLLHDESIVGTQIGCSVSALAKSTVTWPSEIEPTKDDWEAHRPAIIRLYTDQNRTLSEVMRIMHAKYAFKATKKMYKSRLAVWGARKYMTGAERDAARRAIEAKQLASDTCPDVVVRGKIRKFDIYRRHTRRSHANVTKGPINLNNGQSNGERSKRPTRQQPVLETSQHTVCPGGLQRTIETIYKEIFHLVMAKPGDYGSFEMHFYMRSARAQLFANHPNHLADVRVMLDQAADWFSRTLATEPARALLSLLQAQVTVDTGKLFLHKFFACFCGHLLDLTKSRYGPRHSFTNLLRHILQLTKHVDVSEWEYQQLVLMVIANFKNNNTVQVSRWQRSLAIRLEVSGKHHEARALLAEASRSFERESTKTNHDHLPSNSDFADHYIQYHDGLHGEAELISTRILEAGTNPSTGEVDSWQSYHANWARARLAKKRGDIEAAVSFCRLRWQAAIHMWGIHHPETVNAAMFLREYLVNMSQNRCAAELDELTRVTDECSGMLQHC